MIVNGYSLGDDVAIEAGQVWRSALASNAVLLVRSRYPNRCWRVEAVNGRRTVVEEDVIKRHFVLAEIPDAS